MSEPTESRKGSSSAVIDSLRRALEGYTSVPLPEKIEEAKSEPLNSEKSQPAIGVDLVDQVSAAERTTPQSAGVSSAFSQNTTEAKEQIKEQTKIIVSQKMPEVSHEPVKAKPVVQPGPDVIRQIGSSKVTHLNGVNPVNLNRRTNIRRVTAACIIVLLMAVGAYAYYTGKFTPVPEDIILSPEDVLSSQGGSEDSQTDRDTSGQNNSSEGIVKSEPEIPAANNENLGHYNINSTQPIPDHEEHLVAEALESAVGEALLGITESAQAYFIQNGRTFVGFCQTEIVAGLKTSLPPTSLGKLSCHEGRTGYLIHGELSQVDTRQYCADAWKTFRILPYIPTGLICPKA